MNKLYKILFFNFLLISSMITVSAYSWLTMWLGIELNLLSMIPIMLKKNNSYSSEAGMKYFLIQSLASTVLIFSILVMEKKLFNNYLIITILQCSIIMKLGMAPFHWWLPEVMEGLSWENCLIMLTWQKLAPLVMLMMTLKNSVLLSMTIILSSLISGIQGLNQISMRKIMAYSSINHMAWMILSMMSSSWTWMIYFFIYCVSNFILVWYFKKMKIFYINQINLIKNKFSKIFILMNFLSLSGIPPMIGFMPKWLTVHYMIINMNIIMPLILIISSLMHSYFYIRIIIPSLMMKMKESKMLNQSHSINYNLLMLNFMFIMSLIITNFMF
uniref:NADH-ubiquinone oxidoreductase chain 2 n=1 Tax=Cassida sp. EMHAU-15090501 TaxID=2480058 RepID=A0A3G3C765_9CUCU|nr:NADH dehydrogenase subunit 2 [Cassida sp. EMHAU-15090501]